MTGQQEQYAILRFRDGGTNRTSEPIEIDGEGQRVFVSGPDPNEVTFSELKAIFFFGPETGKATPERGSILSIEFNDGEVISGIAPEYNPTFPGFYLYPNDRDRVDKVFIVASAIVSIDVERL